VAGGPANISINAKVGAGSNVAQPTGQTVAGAVIGQGSPGGISPAAGAQLTRSATAASGVLPTGQSVSQTPKVTPSSSPDHPSKPLGPFAGPLVLDSEPPKQSFDTNQIRQVEKNYASAGKCHGNCMHGVEHGTLAGLYGSDVATSVEKQIYRDDMADFLKSPAGKPYADKPYAEKQAAYEEAAEKKNKTDASVDRMMGILKAQGRAGEPESFKFQSKNKAYDRNIENTIVNSTPDNVPGQYFYGVSISGGWHSAVLYVDKTDAQNPKIYLLDQKSKGFGNSGNVFDEADNDMTGRLDRVLAPPNRKDWMKNRDPRIKIWPLYNIKTQVNRQ
jgi:hypothetical protein